MVCLSHMQKIKNILIFEPWTLGDVVVSCMTARALERWDIKTSIACAHEWVDWLKSLSIFEYIIPIHIPWTEKTNKYKLNKYKLTTFISFREELIKTHMNVVCDLRGDIRNYIILKLLRVAPIVSVNSTKGKNVYQRTTLLLRKMGLSTNDIPEIDKNITSRNIICFFGSSWVNRSVPFKKSQEIVYCLVKENYKVSIILQPKDSIEQWKMILLEYKDNVTILQESVKEIAAHIAKADLCLSTDSGWLHVAYYYNVPRIGLFGFNTIQEWAPPNTKIVFSQPLFKANERYKLTNENIFPLENLDVNNILQNVKLFYC